MTAYLCNSSSYNIIEIKRRLQKNTPYAPEVYCIKEIFKININDNSFAAMYHCITFNASGFYITMYTRSKFLILY